MMMTPSTAQKKVFSRQMISKTVNLTKINISSLKARKKGSQKKDKDHQNPQKNHVLFNLT
jgi:hypothetical protein